ncbi:bacteriocin-type signal sequence [Streptococcus suis]|uniref:Bacteriocin-type signal sequence n=3 Tax=Streptococcus TaxID=1301 RepID=A0A0Z8K8P2_STRSU|nr:MULTISPECIES: hypothetical protein [Streptococcus]AXI66175.1 bacteriocin-type signal sequence [Streptococcus suis]EFV96843.1 hypothetical protein HMPREF9171_1691 [Streptococcus agalactiae ATCC 13813]MBL1131837.1 bacteriocin-type signal sequence [Streptococcus suis]MBL6585209.1 bacteriocin-type signal sequence [Streptococcus suis]MBM6438465.1 bacteriocin-type signal sequence [Streptococcus suis]
MKNNLLDDYRNFPKISTDNLKSIKGGGDTVFDKVNHFFCDLINCRGKGRMN